MVLSTSISAVNCKFGRIALKCTIFDQLLTSAIEVSGQLHVPATR
jgi:hypothetical protein